MNKRVCVCVCPCVSFCAYQCVYISVCVCVSVSVWGGIIRQAAFPYLLKSLNEQRQSMQVVFRGEDEDGIGGE